MRKRRRVIALIFLAAGIYGRRQYQKQEQVNNDSAIDRIISVTNTGDTLTGDIAINLNETADNELQYEWGGRYEDFSLENVRVAMSQWERVIIVFERNGDPTSTVLHDDVTSRKERIPKNTVILFADFDTEGTITSDLSIERPNSVIYIGEQWEEMRRKGNGIVSLSQIVSGIDGLGVK